MSLLYHSLHFLLTCRASKVWPAGELSSQTFIVYLWLKNNCHPTGRALLLLLLLLPSSQPFGDCTETDHCDGELVVTVQVHHQVSVHLAVSSSVHHQHLQPDHVCLPKLRANVFLAAGAGAVSGMTCSAQTGVQNRKQIRLLFFGLHLGNKMFIYPIVTIQVYLCIHWT